MIRIVFVSILAVGFIENSDARQTAIEQDESLSSDSDGVEFFEKRIRPILIANCYECHLAEENNGGLRLDTREHVLRGGDSGPAIVPRDVESSLLIQAIKYDDPNLQMPPQNRLQPDEVEFLVKWVEMGAPDPRIVEASVGESGNSPVGMSLEEGRRFWSFQSPQRPAIPDVEDESWIATPIDAFVLSRLEKNGLRPSAEADKRTLIRRVTFDLIGLPPTPSEVNSFLADTRPDAWERLVDRLLATPQYGERWGRHWLDVVRYADSNGLDENLAFGNAWRYRDYVVNSFNDDKSYARMIEEQLAGDLLPNANEQTRIATGFLVLGAKVLAEPDDEKLFMDTIDEQIDATGKVFMGLTLGCARCHDHKFDPVSQVDYYGLAGIFKSTQSFAETKTGVIKHWYEHSFASDEDKSSLEAVDAQIADKNKAASSFKSTKMAEVRTKAQATAVEYLLAAAEISPQATLDEVATIATSYDLHPRILHHCRLHLEYHRNDPFFQEWHRLSGERDFDAIKSYYGTRFEAARLDANEEGVSEGLTSEEIEVARSHLNDASGFLAVPAQPQYAFDTATLDAYYELLETARLFESAAPDVPSAMGVSEGETVLSIPLHIRGSHRNLGDLVDRSIPEVFENENNPFLIPGDQSGRLELARWLANSSHPLTARVFVNRLWRWHFGRALVSTTENFGALGNQPTHAELLDWLATEFVENNWSTKQIHRAILLSNTYRMESNHDGDENREGSKLASELDPENQMYWKFPISRLEAEQIRDAILFVAGELDETMGGKTIPLRNRQFVFNHTSTDHTKYDSRRRAIYLPIVRNHLDPFLEQFDYPDPTMPTGSRHTTLVAPQTLILMNSDLVIESSEAFAKRVLTLESSTAERVIKVYELAYGREPRPKELSRAIRFIDEIAEYVTEESASQTKRFDEGTDGSKAEFTQAELQAWLLFCQSVIASNEFIYLR